MVLRLRSGTRKHYKVRERAVCIARNILERAQISLALKHCDKRLNAGMFPVTFDPKLPLTIVHIRKFNRIAIV